MGSSWEEELRRRREELEGLSREVILEEQGADALYAEEERLKDAIRGLEAKLLAIRYPKFDGSRVKKENMLRREKGRLKDIEIHGVGAKPRDRVYYDSYQAYILKRLPNPTNRLVRVFDMDGEVLDEQAILMLNLNQEDNFWARDWVYVEPSERKKGRYELVGVYNHKGRRIG